ncbi:hypothetical protein JTB14_004495 [Gonioctena quinquepunctata]|nr:hypothetical protein JTB14_004495 [Gonioctena quinquepunctata]
MLRNFLSNSGVDIIPTLMIEKPGVNDGPETTRRKERNEAMKKANKMAPQTHYKRLFTPENIRHLPVLNNNDNGRRIREKGESKIYTDSPEIMERAEVKEQKKLSAIRDVFKESKEILSVQGNGQEFTEKSGTLKKKKEIRRI